jgi:hypothetical protein
MEKFYILVDDVFLKTITKKSQHWLKEFIEETSGKFGSTGVICYVTLCPYCNNFAVLIRKSLTFKYEPNACTICGESTPYYKFKHCIKKAQILYQLSDYCQSNKDKFPKNIQNERVLLEQCVVVLATGIELFFKDIYILSMDLKYVKPEYTLNSKLNADVKNDFLNIGKTVKNFKNEFKIDISKILGQETIKKMTYLLLMRNLIVHNNGFVDSIFLNNIPENRRENYRAGRPIPISKDEIIDFINITEEVLDKIETEFDKIIVPELRKRIETHLEKMQCENI